MLLTPNSGPVLHHLPPGASILAVSVSVPQLDVVLLLAVVVVLLLPDVAVVAITLPARTTVVIATETTNVAIVTVAIVHAALTTGNYLAFCFGVAWFADKFHRDREVKEDREREEGRENGTNGEDRKGEFVLPSRTKN